MTHPLEQAADAVEREIGDLRAKLAVAEDALYGVDIYGSDTLSGRSDGPNDAAWYRDGVKEMRDRARAALAQIKGDE